MDAEGNIVGQPQARSVKGFEETLAAIGTLDDLNKRIEAGEEGLDADLLLAEHTLGKVKGDAFKTRAEALEKTTDAQKKRIGEILVDEEIIAAVMGGRRGPLDPLAEKLMGMLEAGKTPTGKQAKSALWSTLGRVAMQKRDPELAQKAADGMADAYKGEKAAASYVKGFHERATKLGNWKTLSDKVEGGDESCKADLALAELDLGFLRGQAFTDKAKELMATANDEQKAKLEAGLLDVEFQGHAMSGLRGMRDPSKLEEAANALVEMLDAGKAPKGRTAQSVYRVLAIYGSNAKNADMLERAATGWEGLDDKRSKANAKMAREEAAKIKAAAAEEPTDG